MKFNIDVCISFFFSSIEYTHISISIFDNLKYKSSPLFRSLGDLVLFFFSYDERLCV